MFISASVRIRYHAISLFRHVRCPVARYAKVVKITVTCPAITSFVVGFVSFHFNAPSLMNLSVSDIARSVSETVFLAVTSGRDALGPTIIASYCAIALLCAFQLTQFFPLTRNAHLALCAVFFAEFSQLIGVANSDCCTPHR
jgi:hypothetical protein